MNNMTLLNRSAWPRSPTPPPFWRPPALPLKKRLQRAAFFDQRERAVAAGKAEPMSPMAGLPDPLVESHQSQLAAVPRKRG